MKYIDFRSDTSTTPTKEMRAAIFEAELGNDGYHEDPTVNKLEEKVAFLLGKESAILLPSGTMGNLIALMVWCNRGDEVILEASSHILVGEKGGICSIAQTMPIPIEGINGVLTTEQIKKKLHYNSNNEGIQTGLICLENTHNRAGGVIFPISNIKAICKLAHSYKIPVHLDGARIFNAAVALIIDVKEIVKPTDSIMFCLSKGLACPVGSMLVGTHDFIKRARQYRRILGGRMRQAGIIAAAGLVALEEMIDRLKIDNENAYKLGNELSKISFLKINLGTIQTNIVRFVIDDKKIDTEDLIDWIKKEGILIDYQGENNFRMVTHKDIESRDVIKVINCFKKIEKHLEHK